MTEFNADNAIIVFRLLEICRFIVDEKISTEEREFRKKNFLHYISREGIMRGMKEIYLESLFQLHNVVLNLKHPFKPEEANFFELFLLEIDKDDAKLFEIKVKTRNSPNRGEFKRKWRFGIENYYQTIVKGVYNTNF